ncbi:hypothetical protein X962_5788 [Burkholderia pseudomallei MSHR7343]|nr:hypothetical protein DP49_5609 [Burkholderia pseudomallei]KGS19818.1 hypothetical protein X962_5788 [Burkholderia pseudomallei MSHR7343]
MNGNSFFGATPAAMLSYVRTRSLDARPIDVRSDARVTVISSRSRPSENSCSTSTCSAFDSFSATAIDGTLRPRSTFDK